ncbi:hypothetical protein MSG28_009714 [Choristoneura fumiferana]|uniref:Uncharacterized protein n=1 Tax=Choristoneura fumiferana TaxID=7141 RepID=A0ACC0JC71_CHOFU|nr:hypothetical protein MSG28_009714 [Choristoneura fumiferana]
MELEESTETDSEGDNERKERKRPKFRKVIINFYPDANEIAAAYAKVLKYYNWESFVIFKELSGMQESRFLMDCHVDRIPSYLKVAASLNMINPYQHYVLTSMDANMVVQELLKYSSNFTWLSLMDYESLKDPQHYLTVRVGKWTKYNAIPPPPVTNFPIKKKCTVEPCEEDEYPDEEYEGFSVDLVRNIFEIIKEEHNYTAFGSRWVCAMWWFFAMIVCQTYIAQLAASMTTAMENAPIESVEDLAKQTKVLYGAFESGSTLDFFKDKMFRKMYENMLANPGVLVESNEKGEQTVKKGRNKYAFFMESVTIEYKQKRDCALRKVGGVLVESNEKGEQTVKKGRNKYAFFMESVTIEYKQKRDCALRKVGGELDSKDYGIAMPANSPFRSDINRAILKLKENNKLNDIKDKWWNSKKYGAKECPELKASLNFLQLQKPVIRNPSRAPSVASSEKSNKSKKQAQFIENFLELEKEQL